MEKPIVVIIIGIKSSPKTVAGSINVTGLKGMGSDLIIEF
jgi:hypothetical protein